MADLFGTYPKRIKFTVDHTKIDADVTWFPVTVQLDSGQGEEVFAEFDADEDFDRIAFTTSDGETQLYADCELFDDSESVAIYHVSKTGWVLDSDVDTDFYMYYDNDAAHNTTYIGRAGAIPQFTDWTTVYDGSVEPDNDGWTLGGSDYSSSDGDILTIDTSANDTYTCYYYQAPDVNFDNGFYLKASVQAHADMAVGDYLLFWVRDNTQAESIAVHIGDGTITCGAGSASVTTTDTYHIYELYIKATTAYLYMDGLLKTTGTVVTGATANFVGFGDLLTGIMCKANIDYVYYALGVTNNPYSTATHTNVWDTNFKAVYHMNDATTSVVTDSTSNANDGTKKGAGEPVEAAGQVGQGQDFDGTDDYLSLIASSTLNPETGSFTVEAVAKTSGAAADYRAIIDCRESGSGEGYALIIYKTSGQVNWRIEDHNANNPAIQGGTNISDGEYRHIVGVRDVTADKLLLYINGASDAADVTDTTTATINSTANVIIGQKVTLNNLFPFDDVIDEIRISAVARTAAWLKATYNSLYDTLLTYGDEETAGWAHKLNGATISKYNGSAFTKWNGVA